MGFPDTKHPLIEPPALYAQMVGLGVAIENHESDLYVPVTPETTALVKTYRFKAGCTQFTSVREGKAERWYAIPFAYEPFWEQRNARGT